MLLAVVLVISGCAGEKETTESGKNAGQESGKSTATGEPNGVGDEQVTIRMSYFAGSQATIDLTNQIVELFMKKYPHIIVETEFANYESYFEKLSVQAASNSLPDIIRQDYAFIAQYAEKGLLMPLDEQIASGKIDMTDVHPSNLEGGIVDGGMYGINIGNNAITLIYDPASFEQAGVELPHEHWTWEDYEQAVLTLHAQTGLYGDSHQTISSFGIFLRQHEQHLYNEDGTALGYEDDKLFIDFYEMQMRLQKANAISSVAEEMESKGLEDNVFATKKSAMGTFFSNNVETIQKMRGRSLAMSMLPGSGEGKGMYVKPSQFLSIAQSSKNPEEAALFIDFWMNDIEANKRMNTYFGFPYAPKVIKAMEPHFTDAQKKIAEYLGTVQKYAAPIDPPDPNRASEVKKLLTNVSQEYFFDRISVQEAAAKFRESANAILAKNK